MKKKGRRKKGRSKKPEEINKLPKKIRVWNQKMK